MQIKSNLIEMTCSRPSPPPPTSKIIDYGSEKFDRYYSLYFLRTNLAAESFKGPNNYLPHDC